jgi:hypothetical protein
MERVPMALSRGGAMRPVLLFLTIAVWAIRRICRLKAKQC